MVIVKSLVFKHFCVSQDPFNFPVVLLAWFSPKLVIYQNTICEGALWANIEKPSEWPNTF